MTNEVVMVRALETLICRFGDGEVLLDDYSFVARVVCELRAARLNSVSADTGPSLESSVRKDWCLHSAMIRGSQLEKNVICVSTIRGTRSEYMKVPTERRPNAPHAHAQLMPHPAKAQPLSFFLDYSRPKLSIPSISVRQPKHLLPRLLPASFRNFPHLRQDHNMITRPHQPPIRLIVEQLAFHPIQDPFAPKQRRCSSPFLPLLHSLTPTPVPHPARLKHAPIRRIPPPEPVRHPRPLTIPAQHVDVELAALRDGLQRPRGQGNVEGDQWHRVQRQRGEGGHGHAARDRIGVGGRAYHDGAREEAHHGAEWLDGGCGGVEGGVGGCVRVRVRVRVHGGRRGRRDFPWRWSSACGGEGV